VIDGVSKRENDTSVGTENVSALWVMSIVLALKLHVIVDSDASLRIRASTASRGNSAMTHVITSLKTRCTTQSEKRLNVRDATPAPAKVTGVDSRMDTSATDWGHPLMPTFTTTPPPIEYTFGTMENTPAKRKDTPSRLHKLARMECKRAPAHSWGRATRRCQLRTP
jgi:hypothetical protein